MPLWLKFLLVNTSQLVGTQEGDIIVPNAYSWAQILQSVFHQASGYKKIPTLPICSPGIVFVREYSDSNEVAVNTVLTDPRWTPSSMDLPDNIPRPGLSREQQYLYDKIREFCTEDSRIESALSLQHCSLSPTIARTKKNPLQSVRDGVVSADSRDTLDEPVQRWKTKLCVCACIYLPVCYNSKEETPRQSHVTIAQYIT